MSISKKQVENVLNIAANACFVTSNVIAAGICLRHAQAPEGSTKASRFVASLGAAVGIGLAVTNIDYLRRNVQAYKAEKQNPDKGFRSVSDFARDCKAEIFPLDTECKGERDKDVLRTALKDSGVSDDIIEAIQKHV